MSRKSLFYTFFFIALVAVFYIVLKKVAPGFVHLHFKRDTNDEYPRSSTEARPLRP